METTTKETNKVYTLDFFKKAGKRGGLKTKKKYGTSHFSKINPKKRALDKGVV